jgi:hypothetical protein
MVPGEYALWRTATPNFAIRPVMPAQAGQLRHLGSADPDCRQFAISVDVNGVTWEHFSADQQAWEIAATWPGASRVAGD